MALDYGAGGHEVMCIEKNKGHLMPQKEKNRLITVGFQPEKFRFVYGNKTTVINSVVKQQKSQFLTK